MKIIDANILPKKRGIFLVGGAIRDFFIGRTSLDYDVVVLGDPEPTAKQIALKSNGRLIKIGKGCEILYRIVSKFGLIDLTRLRGSNIIEDLAHRDFTINAMAHDLCSGKLIDPHGGLDDIIGKTVRMISAHSFREDPVRLLRAYRIAAQLGFGIHEPTTAAIKEWAPMIKTIPGERISTELYKFLEVSNTCGYLSQMEISGLLTSMIPELEELKGCVQNKYHHLDVFSHTLTAYKHVEAILQQCNTIFPKYHDRIRPCICKQAAARLKCAVLLHDIGKPSVKTVNSQNHVHFYKHGEIGAEMAKTIVKRLRFGNRDMDYLGFVIRNHSRPMILFNTSKNNQLNPKTVTRLFIKTGKYTPDVLLHAMADALGKAKSEKQAAFIKFIKKLIHRFYTAFKPAEAIPPLVTGHDLISEFGLVPSPAFKILLNRVEEKRLSNIINTRKEALNMIHEILKAQPNDF